MSANRTRTRPSPIGHPFDLGSVRQCDQAVGDDERDAEDRLHVGLVPAREGAPRVGRLELRRRDRVRALVVGVGRPVEPTQLVVELAAEVDREGATARADGSIASIRVARWSVLVEHDVGDRDLAPASSARTVALSIERSTAFTTISSTRSCTSTAISTLPENVAVREIGLEYHVVSRRHDGARQSEAVVHGRGDYRAAARA